MMKLKGLMNKEGMKNLFKNKKVVVAIGFICSYICSIYVQQTFTGNRYV